MPDNLNIPQLPAAITAFCVYTRVNLNPASPPKRILVRLQLPDGQELKNEVEADLIAKTVADSFRDGNPLATLISRMTTANLPIKNEGRILCHVVADDEEWITGSLKIVSNPALINP